MTKSFNVLGLAYGDEGKGSFVDHLTRKHGIRLIVRYNGGVQAAHHVHTTDGRVHCFHQFGSGTLVPGTRTLLSHYMLLEPQLLLNEAEELEQTGVVSPLQGMLVDENAPVVTPFNRLLNRIIEVARGASLHGSCGLGIGLTQGDVETLGDEALYVRDLRSLSASALRKKLERLHELKVGFAVDAQTDINSELVEQLKNVDIDAYMDFYKRFCSEVSVLSSDETSQLLRDEDSIFEGAQGLLLDQTYGFFPHVTRSNCLFKNADELLENAGFSGAIERIGLLRGYGTRHGAGPFISQSEEAWIEPCDNRHNAWQGQFRHGWFDAVAARYALSITGKLDMLAISNLDRMYSLVRPKICIGYKNTDPRFFTEREILVPSAEPNYDVLRERTESMSSIEAEYCDAPRVSPTNVTDYLDRLEELVDHPIHAYSVSPDHNKVYR